MKRVTLITNELLFIGGILYLLAVHLLAVFGLCQLAKVAGWLA